MNDGDHEYLQAMPQLTDRSKLPNIVDPVIKDAMDLKHLYQVLNTKHRTSENHCVNVSGVLYEGNELE